jgi:hypothetical protein
VDECKPLAAGAVGDADAAGAEVDADREVAQLMVETTQIMPATSSTCIL